MNHKPYQLNWNDPKVTNIIISIKMSYQPKSLKHQTTLLQPSELWYEQRRIGKKMWSLFFQIQL